MGRKSSPDESPTYDHGRGEGRCGSSNGKKTTRVGLGAGGVEENRGEFIPAPLRIRASSFVAEPVYILSSFNFKSSLLSTGRGVIRIENRLKK